MDLRKVKKLIELLEASDLSEIEICEGEEMVRLSRAASRAPIDIASPAAQVVKTVQTKEGDAGEKVEQQPSAHELKSPMVGTFYQAPAPEEPPFVQIGKAVKKGDVVCIIEAMKMMNQIEADRAGVISAILVENGQAVEYDQVLMRIS